MVQRVKRRERRQRQESDEREDMVRTARYYAGIYLKVDKLDARLKCVAGLLDEIERGRVFAPGEFERLAQEAEDAADKTNEQVEAEVQAKIDEILKKAKRTMAAGEPGDAHDHVLRAALPAYALSGENK